MKKPIITLAIILGITLGASAQNGGLFGKGPDCNYDRYDSGPNESLLLPSSHGNTDDSNAPLGSGALMLIGLGAAYATVKKRNK